MKTLTIPYYSASNTVTPSKTIAYRFNPNDQYKGEKVLSITRSSELNYQSGQTKTNVLTITKVQWPGFCNWLKEEVIKPGKTESKPLFISGPNGFVKFSFNRDEEYKGSRFICIHKKDTRSGQLTYQNLAVSKDQWPEFSKWMREVIEEKPGF
jgi:hypothetical protein